MKYKNVSYLQNSLAAACMLWLTSCMISEDLSFCSDGLICPAGSSCHVPSKQCLEKGSTMPHLLQVSPPGNSCLIQQFKGGGSLVYRMKAAVKFSGRVANKENETIPARIVLAHPSLLPGGSLLKLQARTTDRGNFQLYPTVGEEYLLMVIPESTHISKYVPYIERNIRIDRERNRTIVLQDSSQGRQFQAQIRLPESETRTFQLKAKAVPTSRSTPEEKYSTEAAFCVSPVSDNCSGSFSVTVSDDSMSHDLHIWGPVKEPSDTEISADKALEWPIQTLACKTSKMPNSPKSAEIYWPSLHPIKISIRVQDGQKQPIPQAAVIFELVSKNDGDKSSQKEDQVCTTIHTKRGTTDDHGDARFQLLGSSERELLNNYWITVITPSESHAASLRRPFPPDSLGGSSLHIITLVKRQLLHGQIFSAKDRPLKTRVQATVLSEHTSFLATRSTAHADDSGEFHIPIDVYHRPFSLRFTPSPSSGSPRFILEKISLENLQDPVVVRAPKPVLFLGTIDASDLPPQCRASKEASQSVQISALRTIRTIRQRGQTQDYHDEIFEIGAASADAEGNFSMLLPNESNLPEQE